MPVLRYLNVQLRLAADDFNNKIKAASKEAKEFENTIRPSQELLKQIGTTMTAAGVVVVGSLTAMAKSAANYGSELNKASQRTGATVQELARLKFAAEQNDATFDDLTRALQGLARNTDEVSKGTKGQVKLFKDLGVQVQDSSGKIRPLNNILLDVADKFARMEDGAEKAALAQEIFGKSGTALIPLLSQGSAGIQRMGDQAERLGLVMGDDAAKAGEEFNDTLDEVGKSLQGVANTIGVAILPSLTKMAAITRDTVITFKDFAAAHPGLTKAALALGVALTGAGGVVLGLTALGSIIPKVKLAVDSLRIAYNALAASALAAQLGVAGLGAALGVGIGMLINWAIEGTKVRAVMDDMARWAGSKIFSNAAQDSQTLLNATVKLSDAMRKQGIIVERGTDSVDSYNKRVMDAARSSGFLERAAAQYVPTQNSVNTAVTRGVQVTKELTAAQKEANREFQELYEIFLKERIAIHDNARALREYEAAGKTVAAIQRELIIGADKIQELPLQPVGLDVLPGLLKEANVEVKTLTKTTSEMSKALSVALGNVTRDFANALTDSIFRARKWSDAMKGLAMSTAKSMLNSFLVGLLEPLTSKLAGLGSSIGKLFGGGGGVAGTASSVAGAAQQAGGGLGGMAGGAGSITGGLISAVGGVVGGIIAGVSSMRQEGTLNAVEFNTRASRIHLGVMIDYFFHPWNGHFASIRDDMHMVTMQLDAIYNVLAAGSGSASNSVEFDKRVVRAVDKEIKTGGKRQEWAMAFSQTQGVTATYPVG